MIDGLANFWNDIKSVAFGYDATVDKSRRARPATVTKSEDSQLTPHERRKAIATQRDQIRNLTWVQWMANRHLDYVSQFEFRGTTDDDALNEKLEGLMDEWSEPDNCDIGRRHDLSELMRLYESGKVIDGDVAFMKVRGALQGIESDRICKPQGGTFPQNISDHGLLLREDSSVRSYCVCKRDGNGMLIKDRMVPAENMFFDGYFKRFDQTRGISPLLTALNNNQDLYENFEYTLIKIKMHAMFGTQITRQMPSTNDGWGYDSETYTSEENNTFTTYEFDLSPAMKIEMEPGDEIKTIESNTPSDEFQDYSELMMRITFLALDIPFTMFNSKQSNNNAMRSDFRQYIRSARRKQGKNRRVLNGVTRWKLNQWLVQGKLTLDEYRRASFAWIATGMPIIDPGTEIPALAEEVANGFNSRTEIARERGRSWRQIKKDLQREEQDIKEAGIKGIMVGKPGQSTVGETQETGNTDGENPQLKAGRLYMIGNKLIRAGGDTNE